MKIEVERFNLGPTPSFEYAPQREEYDSDSDHMVDVKAYAAEWRAKYQCMNQSCHNPDCPTHHNL